MTIIGSQRSQHQDHMEKDGRSYSEKTYTLKVRLYDSGGIEGELARKNFETMLLNIAILAGAGGVRVEDLTD